MPICGPENYGESRFFVSNYGIWAGNYDGSLWYNRTKKANADRLQFVTDGSGQLVVPTGKTVSVPIHYTHTAYYEPVDSLSFILNYSDALVFDHDSASAGWDVIRREVGQSSVKIILGRTDPAPATPDSLIATLFFHTLVTTERSATVALDEINFNQDTTFRECMVASLTKNDTLFIDLTDACGDSLIREYLRHDGMLQIDAIRPNPSSGAVRLSVRSAADGVAAIEVVNALGEVVASHERGLTSGMNEIELPTSTLPNGVYYVRLRSHGDTVGASVVIER
ncbi:MAG: T9SS type A sorting domain-containing protein [Bacteroidetes bacterium]|nr:T9SS type A sorting domain-containing protein [Bacteroidota bacterium]